MTTTNELPFAVPLFNLAVSLLAMAGISWITIRRSQSTRRLLINLTGLTAILVLVAGALFQANMLPLSVWVLIGSGGRLAVLSLVLLFVFTPEEYDHTDEERNAREDRQFGDQRRMLEHDHKMRDEADG